MSQRSVGTAGWSEDLSFDTIVLLGRSSITKHLVRSTILSYDDIKPNHSTYEVSCEINGEWISVVETADLSNTPNPDAEKQILECMGPLPRSVFLLVLQHGLVSQEDIKAFIYLLQTFGQAVVDKMVPVLVVTKEKSPSDVAEQNLGRIVHACNGRLCLFHREMDRMELLDNLKELYRITQNREIPELKRSESHTSEEFSPSELSSTEETKQEDDTIEVNGAASMPERANMNGRNVMTIVLLEEKSSAVVSDGGRNVMTIVLLGQTGSGKSATGNTILAKRHFESRASSTAITQECKRAEELVCGIKVRVVDTPDFFDEDLKSPEIHIQKCKELSQIEPVVYILVMHMGRFTEGEREIVTKIQKTFGKDMVEKMIILFTGKEKLKGRRLEDFVTYTDPLLQQLIKKTGSRCHAFNNNDQSCRQVKKLIQMIVEMHTKQGQNIKELYPGYKRSKNKGCTVM